MAVSLAGIGIGTLASAVTSLVVLAALIGLVYRWVAGSDGDDGGDGDADGDSGSGATAGPLASWRSVYDVEKADANREVAAVQQQAEDLAEADEGARR
jgi:hypothetical protein